MTEEQKALPAPKPAKNTKVWPLWIVIIIVTAASASLFFYGWHQLTRIDVIQTEFQQMHLREQQLQQANEQLATEVRTLNQQREGLNESFRAEQSAITEQLATLSTQLLQMGGASRTEWLLAEAEYLLRLANQRLNIERDVSGAIKVLQSADAVLADADDAGLYPVRKQLRDEILALQMIGDSDRDGLYLQLEAIINRVDGLEQAYFIKQNTATAKDTKKQDTAEPSQIGAEAWWQLALTELKTLIVFRKLDAPVEPMLSPEQSFYLKQNLRLILEQAQLALLKKNQPLYRGNLSKASKWITTYFPMHETRVQVIHEQLNSLENKNIDPELPEISGSLNQLKQRIQLLYRQHALPPVNTTDKEGA